MFEDVSEARRRTMRAIRSKNTKAELIVRSFLFGRGYRFRIHWNGLPGRPDIVFSRRRKVVEIRGCFWHGHECPCDRGLPKTRTDYWLAKRTRTYERDQLNEIALESLGWQLFVIWECELIKSRDEAFAGLLGFLGPPLL
ncbi:very short patch repair endonuclease [Rhizobium leguminosarum]